MSCKARSTAAFPRTTPVEPPKVKKGRKIMAKIAELETVMPAKSELPRTVQNQLKGANENKDEERA